MLEVRDLVAGYRRAPVVGPLSFSLERGEVLIFVGPNGAGKSTLFRTLATLQKPLAGKVFLDGDPLERKADRVFFLGERVEMPESLTGAEYLRVVSSLYGETADPEPYLRYAGVPAEALLRHLSQGQRRRVQLASALFVSRPLVYLLDDPSIGLDDVGAEELVPDLVRRLKEAGKVTLVATRVAALVERLRPFAAIVDMRKISRVLPDTAALPTLEKPEK
ncbi:MAG: ABC transporter involved in cytochrome c biogenesis, ATPase component CcmA [Brockia lithotrophica]|uniref:ABC transporter involved in cytochrome c biogenesis, ATPase component CcmA n=1 Tax=Brockia lithotrophica TaxID=933949 RepID=A0A2T5G605_9BACL|nr:ABC transporter ATP-binding protein [Brockia lithotrophica]PTQ51620.1 MAG: ABC transporter involved in cytochrome c biogenesis, ATPase component CcmA [Brockia lithotrophica]